MRADVHSELFYVLVIWRGIAALTFMEKYISVSSRARGNSRNAGKLAALEEEEEKQEF